MAFIPPFLKTPSLVAEIPPEAGDSFRKVQYPAERAGFIHTELAAGRWHTLSLAEQMGNVGGEVSRAIKWRGRDDRLYQGAIDRALELLDLTAADPRWRGGRLRELARAREVFCDAITGGGAYKSTLQDIDRYFFQFALAARAALR